MTTPLPDLSGEYRLVFVATEDEFRGRRTEGILRLWRRPPGVTGVNVFRDTFDLSAREPFLGTADLDLKAVGAGVEGRLDTLYPHPGVVIEVWREEDGEDVGMGLGSDTNRHDALTLDGLYTRAVLRTITPAGFSGTWEAFAGPTTYHMEGYFCALRTSSALPPLPR